MLALSAGPALVMADDPGEPITFHGMAEDVDGNPVPVGTDVVAVVDGDEVDRITVEEDGVYAGDEPTDEKLRTHTAAGDTVTFHVDGPDGPQAAETHDIDESGLFELNLTFPADAFAPAPDPAEFQVGLDVPDEVEEGDTFTIAVEVENVGEESDEQAIRISVNGEEIDSSTVSLDGGESTTISTQYDVDDSDDLVVEAESDDDSDDATVAVVEDDDPPPPPPPAPDPAEFAVDVDAPDAVALGSDIEITTTVENVGDEAGDGEVIISVDGEEIDRATVDLGAGESESIETAFTADEPVEEHTIEAESDDDSDETTVAVEFDPAEFDITIDDDASTLDVQIGEAATLLVEVDNPGEVAGEEDVAVTLDGEPIDTQSVSLDAGTGTTLEVPIDTGELPAGDHPITVDGEHDSDNAMLVVEPPPDAPYLAVDIVAIDESVDVGDPITVDANVTNTGDQLAAQTVTFSLDGEVVTTESVDLGPGEGTTLQVSLDTDNEHVPTVDVAVASDNETVSETVDVRGAAEYDVSIVDAPSVVDPNTSETVTVQIENVGAGTGEEPIELIFDDEVQDERTVDLEPGETTVLEFDFATGPEETTSVLEAASRTDSSVTRVTVGTTGNFHVVDLDVADTEAGAPIVLNATIENDGAVTGTQSIGLIVDGDFVAEDERTLEPGESDTVTLEAPTAVDEAGSVSVILVTDDDTASETVQVLEPAAFVVEIDLDPSAVIAGETAEATITVHNEGEVTGETDVDVAMNGSIVATTPVTVAPDESETVTVSIDTEGDDVGEPTVVATTPDDEATAVLTVGEPGALAVDVRSVTDPVTPGEVVNVTVEFENVGDEPITDDLTVRFDGETVAEESVTVDPGETVRRTVSEELPADIATEQSIEVEVESSEETDTETVAVVEPAEDAYLRVSDLDLPSTVDAGETMAVSARVTNIGGQQGTDSISLVVNEDVVATTGVDLGPDERETITFDVDVPAPGVMDVTFASSDDETGTSVTVREPEPANVEVVALDVPAAASAGEDVDVTLTVENTGDLADTGTVTVTLSDETSDTTVSLDGGETDTVTMSLPVPAEPRAGTFDRELTATTPHDDETASIAVDYGSIQSGIDEADTGDTVRIAPETFDETVTVDTTGITLSAPDGATVDAGGAAVAVEVTASSVTLDGLSISAAGTGVSVAADGATLDSLRIDDVDTAIHLEDAGDHAVLDLRAEGVDTGVLVEDAGGSEIAHSRFLHVERGVEVHGVDTLVRASNFVDGGTGVLIEADGATVRSSEISDHDVGIRVRAGQGIDITTNNLERNDVSVYSHLNPIPIDANDNWWGDPAGPDPADIIDREEETVVVEAWAADRLDPASFAITDVTVPDGGVVGEVLALEVTIENVGERDGRQDIDAVVDGEVVDSVTGVDIPGGEVETVTLEYTPEVVHEELQVAIESDDDSHDSEPVVVQAAAEFTVETVDVPDRIDAGETITGTVVVENVGGVADTAEITVLIDGEPIDEDLPTLEPGEVAEIPIEHVVDDPGELTLSVETQDHEASQTVVVEVPPDPATMAIEIIDLPDAVERGESITVTVAVSNVGDEPGTDTLTLSFADGLVVDERDVELDPSRSDEVSFTIDVPADASIDDQPIVIEGADDVDTATITVLDGMEPATFDIELVTLDDVVDRGDTITAVIEVTNVGEEAGEETVVIDFADGTVTIEEGVALQPGESAVLTVDVDVPDDAPIDDQPVSVAGSDAETSATITVTETLDPATFDLAVADHDETVVQGASLEITVEVTNVGDEVGQETLVLEFADGEVTQVERVELGPGERETLAFTVEVTDAVSTGDRSVLIEGTDDELTTTVTVEEPDDDIIPGLGPLAALLALGVIVLLRRMDS